VRDEFNEDVDTHHNRWRETVNKDIMEWLYPENVKLKKEYNGAIHKPHLETLNMEEWNKEKVIF
jgi:hypothetical protein